QNWGADASPLSFPGRIALRTTGPSLFRFGRWLWLANIFKILINYLDFFLLNLWFGPITIGVYALALGLASRADIVNQSLYTVLIPTASALKSKRDVLAYLRRGFLRSALASLALLLLVPLAQWFIPFFYGQEFQPAVDMFRLLLGVAIFDIFALPALLLIYTFNRPELAALAEACRVVTLILAGLWLIPILGPIGAVAAKLSAKIIGVLVTLVLLTHHALRRRRLGADSSSTSSF
ncbi:MAG: oligosaccharide flippase family protein, partial [Anaerolineae bacterium]|nr:oligosaccharide flippase family protein [Anaerolineae bacterium]